MLTVKEPPITPITVLVETPSLQDLAKPYHQQYKTTVDPRTVVKSQTWLAVKVCCLVASSGSNCFGHVERLRQLWLSTC